VNFTKDLVCASFLFDSSTRLSALGSTRCPQNAELRADPVSVGGDASNFYGRRRRRTDTVLKLIHSATSDTVWFVLECVGRHSAIAGRTPTQNALIGRCELGIIVGGGVMLLIDGRFWRRERRK